VSISCAEVTKLVIDAAAALGTIAVAAMAIWGERIRAWVAPPKLRLLLRSQRGVPTELRYQGVNMAAPIRALYIHIKVVNGRPWLPVRNCRVLLTGYSKRGPDRLFHSEDVPVPLQFPWAPNHSQAERFRTVVTFQVIDFVRAVEGQKYIGPELYDGVTSFKGYVEQGEAIRYQIEIDAPGLPMSVPQIFEISWSGQWSFEAEIMEKYLRVREVTGKNALTRSDGAL
jgi:hypothetical protein